MRTTVLSVSSADTPNGIAVTAILMVNANAAVLPVFFIFQFPLCAAYTKVCHGGAADSVSGSMLAATIHCRRFFLICTEVFLTFSVLKEIHFI